MFTLRVAVSDGDGGGQTASATIEVLDENGTVRADVLVEVYEGVPRLALCPAMVERDSDGVVTVIDLLTGRTVA